MTVETKGFRVLVVEDELLIALDVEDTLNDLGCDIVGSVGKLDDAIEIAMNETLDAAILDVTIRGGEVFPVAEILLGRGIPFVLASGHDDWALPENMRDRPRLKKPFTKEQLEEKVRLLCNHAASQRAGRP